MICGWGKVISVPPKTRSDHILTVTAKDANWFDAAVGAGRTRKPLKKRPMNSGIGGGANERVGDKIFELRDCFDAENPKIHWELQDARIRTDNFSRLTIASVE